MEPAPGATQSGASARAPSLWPAGGMGSPNERRVGQQDWHEKAARVGYVVKA